MICSRAAKLFYWSSSSIFGVVLQAHRVVRRENEHAWTLAFFVFSHIFMSSAQAREYSETAIRFSLACVLREKNVCKSGAGDARFRATAVLSNFGALRPARSDRFD